ncbi:MAG: hypothetical protein L0H63_15550, partial [Nitrococcus sp.]|nr:hypothetical protein [Nitrococcus sp.]
PPTIFLDTRTQRDYDSAEGAAHLIGKAGRQTTRQTIARAGHQPGEPLIFVSPVPLYCLELQERRQKFLKDKVGPYAIDLEGWHSNLQGLVDWMAFLIDELRLPWCLVLSGDVHYGMNLKATFSCGEQALVITQLVSSAHKHSGGVSRTVLNLLGKMVGKTHERIGWERPPKTVRASGIKRLLALRPATTDAWAEDAPVFLAPRRAQQLGIEEPPHYREEREYVPAVGSHTLNIVGNNNTGLLSISGDEITHQLLCPTDGEVRIYTAAFGCRGQD